MPEACKCQLAKPCARVGRSFEPAALSRSPLRHLTLRAEVTSLLPCQHREDWGLDDPSGKSDEEFRVVRNLIHAKMKDLLRRLESGAV